MGSIRPQGTYEEMARIIAGGAVGGASIYPRAVNMSPVQGTAEKGLPLVEVVLCKSLCLPHLIASRCVQVRALLGHGEVRHVQEGSKHRSIGKGLG